MTSNVTPHEVRASNYKAKIDSVSPVGRRNNFDQQDECFLGVSLENEMFDSPKLDATLEWISRRFNKCTVLVGDSIHRLTLQSVSGLNIEHSKTRAHTLGQDFIAQTNRVFTSFSDRTKFDFLTCGAVQQWPDYNFYYNQLLHAFEYNPGFCESVRQFSRRYHGRQSSDTATHDLDERIAISSQYFLEEFAIFACLQQQGLSIMVYPGSFSTLTEIAEGAHVGVPSELRSLVVVSLHLKSRRKVS